jgi:ferric-dicitrate binding protein FerR (iron transport regulator)
VGSYLRGTVTSVRGFWVVPGSAIFSGDIVTVGAGGSAVLHLAPASQLYLGAETSVQLMGTSEGVQVDMTHGKVVFETSRASRVQGRIADAVIGAAGATPSRAVVTFKSSTKALIAADQGSLVVATEHDARSVILGAGQGVEVTLVDDQQTEEKKKRRRRAGAIWGTSGKQIAVLGAVAIVVVSLIWLSRDEGPAQGGLISPFRFP